MNTLFAKMPNYFILLILMLFFSKACNNKAQQLPDQAFKHWMHSFEEDKGDIQIFRPSTHHFLPALGRDGFEFKPANEYIWYRIGPADGVEEVKGKWTFISNDQLKVDFHDTLASSFELQILELSDTLLKIKRIQ